ncbi:MAG: hypothetical protein QM690_18465 [Sphingobium sp.]
MSIIYERAQAVAETASRIKAIGLNSDADASDPEKVARARAILAELAARKELFPIEHFPQIKPGLTGFYRLIEDEDGDNSLNIVVSSIHYTMPGLHSHPGWALIAGVNGAEYNHLYTRIDNRSVEGEGRLRKNRDVTVGTGDVLFLSRHDYHTVSYDGREPAIHLHFYGRNRDNPHPQGEHFASADAETYTRGRQDHPRRHKGVPKVGIAEIREAAAHGGLEVILIAAEGTFPGAIPGAETIYRPEQAALSGQDIPVLLVGEAPDILVVAEHLARQRRRPILRAGFAEALEALHAPVPATA